MHVRCELWPATFLVRRRRTADCTVHHSVDDMHCPEDKSAELLTWPSEPGLTRNLAV